MSKTAEGRTEMNELIESLFDGDKPSLEPLQVHEQDLEPDDDDDTDEMPVDIIQATVEEHKEGMFSIMSELFEASPQELVCTIDILSTRLIEAMFDSTNMNDESKTVAAMGAAGDCLDEARLMVAHIEKKVALHPATMSMTHGQSGQC